MAIRKIQRFEVIGRLGAGGMGTVYHARDPQLEREVAIKVLARPAPAMPLVPGDTIDLRAEARTSSDDLLHEARMMARVSHPNVLPVYEVGLADGAVFVVMEYVAGTDLAAWLATPRSSAEIAEVFAQAARGLAAAHARAIVHRDFKPANVLVGRDGHVRVADFGLSRWTGPTTALVRIGDGRGTPRYMAPELVRGDAATARSDTFALCAALAEAFGADPLDPADARDRALRERGVRPRLRDAIAAGLASDPAARPDVTAVLAALEARSRRWYFVAAGAALALAAAGGIAAAAHGHRASCVPDPALFAGRWSLERRVALIAALPRSSPSAVAGIAAELDHRRLAIEGQLAASCAAVRSGALAASEGDVRASCLDRRAFEIGATVDHIVAIAPDAVLARDRVETIPEAAECADLVAPPLAADRSAALALYTRWARIAELGPAERTAELAAIEPEATRLGEHELAARAAYLLGVDQRFADRLADADATEQRAYRAALELHSTNIAANTLVERSTIAALRGDATSATQLAQLAQDAAAKPTTSVRTRVRLDVALGRAAHDRGDFSGAIARLQDGLALIASSGKPMPAIETALRFSLIASLAEIGGRAPESIRVARETVELVERSGGHRDPNYGVALNLLAYALRSADDVAGAVPVRRQALEVMEATLPADDSHVALEHSDLAADLWALGELDAAQREIALALAQAEHNEALAGNRATLLPLQAIIAFDRGQFTDAQRTIEHSLELAIGQFGTDHPTTQDVRSTQIGFELELGQLDAAERHVGALEAGYRARADSHGGLLAHGTLEAEIAIARGRPVVAERDTREAVAALAELHPGDDDRLTLDRTLGRALAAEQRWPEARAALAEARDLAHRTQQRADVVAAIEIDLAGVEAGSGHRAEARQHAAAARAVLERFPGQVLARARADALLK